MTLALTPRQQQHLWQSLLLVLVLLPLLLLALWWYGKHQEWRSTIERQDGLYARLDGMQLQKEQITDTLQQVQADSTQFLYPAEGDGDRAGNAALQQVRAALGRAGMRVASSQVKVIDDAQAPADYQRVELLITTEGQWAALQTALAELRRLRPMLWVDGVQIQLKGSLQNANPAVEQTLSANLRLSLRKIHTGAAL